jgi:hypothetical protein
MADINLTFGADDLKKVVAEIQKAAKSLNAALKKTGIVTNEDVAKAKKLAKTAKLLNAEKKKLNTTDRERIKIAKQLDTVNAKLALANSKEARTLAAKKKQLQDINRQLRTGSKNTATWGKALGSFQFKFNALGNIAASATAAMTRALRQGIRNAIKTVAEFDQAMADVQSITRATKKDFDALSKSARALGGTTKFTATQVAQLQKEYAKLGFTTKEILNAQAATLDLAAATGTDLARAAEVVGITVRQFGFNAKEAGRVTDVMAKSFTTSALDMEKFAEAMKFVGPAAKASGISIERTTALLGQLADAGISGSMAGTSLRQIMLALSKESGTLTEKLERAAEGGLDLAGASEEVQKRAATALLVLADGVDTIDDFTLALENSAGAAQEMADVQLDTLRGKATLLKSAWEGMTLAMLGTEENAEIAKRSLGGLTRVINAMQTSFESGVTFQQALFINRVTRNAIKEMNQELEKSPLALEEIRKNGKGVLAAFKQIGREIWQNLTPPKELDEPVSILPDIAELTNFEEEWKKMFAGLTEDVELGEEFWDEWFEGFSETTDEILKEDKETLEKMAAAHDEQIEKDKERYDKEVELFEQKEQRKRDIASASFELANTLGDALIQIRLNELDAELKAVEGNAEKVKEVQRQQAKERQDLAVKETLINTAVAIGLAFAQFGWPAGIIPAALALAAGTAQVAVIKSQQFAEGGPVEGEPHSRGGVNIEAEGGEYVINKRSTGKYRDLIEAINQDDQVRIMDAMSRDRKIIVKQSDPYTQKMYELMQGQVQYGEDNEYYYKHKGNMLIKTRKN